MKFKITPKVALLSVKYWVHVIVCWPPPSNATRRRLIIHNIAWCVVIFFPMHLIPALILDVATKPLDLASITRHVAEGITLLATILKMIVCRYHESRLQVLCEDLEIFIETTEDREKAILDRYFNNFGTFHICLQVGAVLGAIAFCCGPLILDQPLPGQTEYPFPWRHSPTLTAILFLTHAIAIIQISGMGILDMMLAWLVWFNAMRFELLAEDFGKARTSRELRGCIKKHQELLIYVDDMRIISKAFILFLIVISGMTNICAGYQFVSHQRYEIVIQYFLLLFVTSMEVMVYAWPCDYLIAASVHIGDAAFYAPWIERTEMAKDIEIVIRRSHKPVVIELSGILSRINMEFYGKYLTTVFSYFTTLRAFAD